MNRVKNQKVYMMIFPLLLLFLFLSVAGGKTFNTKLQEKLLVLDRGWNMSYLGTNRSDVKLGDSKFGRAKKNQSVTLSKSLPYIKVNSACVAFRSVLSSVDVYVAGEKIYSYGHEYADVGKMIPKHINYISLPEFYAGKMLRIVVTPGADDAFSGLSEVYFGSRTDLGYFLLQRNRLPLVVGTTLVFLGMCLIILLPVIFYSGETDYLVLYYALVSIVLGVYILCYNDVIYYFVSDAYVTTIIEYVALYLIAPITLNFIREDLKERGILNKILILIVVIDFAFAVLAFVYHCLGISYVDSFVTPYHIIVIPQGLFTLWAIIRNILARERRSKNVTMLYGAYSVNILLTGMMVFVFCGIVDILRFNYMKFLSGSGEVYSSISFITIGAMIFVTCLLCNYFFHCIDHINEASTRKKLEGMAYEDALTGLSNRAYCERQMDKADQSRKPYVIISMDLDGLKATNDKYGHIYGDRLLKGFAEILKNSFPGASLIGRMGGDEFLILLSEEKTGMASLYLTAMERHIREYNEQDEKLQYGVSWGMCNSREINGNAHRIYMEADSRMYKMKEEHHRAGGGRHV